VTSEHLHQKTLDDPYFISLLYDNAPIIKEFIPSDLVPVICISYKRRRFICHRTGHRLCLDTNIEGTRVNGDVLPSISDVKSNMIVCEFKDNGVEVVPVDWTGQRLS